jgi:predicted GH43/DUF377 family glycosyl hydrolase
LLYQKKYIVHRCAQNPILTKDDFPGDIVSVFNSGIIKHNGKYVMICRCEDSSFSRYMWVAQSDDGIKFTLRDKPLAMPVDDPLFREYVDGEKSYWDPRITCIEGQHYIVHAADVTNGASCQLGLFKIDDSFEKLEWMGLISEPDNRNGVLFPRKINGLYYRLDRPNDNGGFDIWACSSPDLIYWGNPRRVLSKSLLGWGEKKIGPGAVPIETDAGWLCIIHGVRRQCTDEVYSLGVMLLDRDDPTKLIACSRRAILAPEEPYELLGQSMNVVFTNGAVAEDDGSIKIYYGGADQVQCLATARIDDLIDSCLNDR